MPLNQKIAKLTPPSHHAENDKKVVRLSSQAEELSDVVKSQQLGHLGLLSAVLNEIGLIDKINERLPLDEKKGGIVPYGERCAAMILNGLGFINTRLYLSPLFFEDKPVSHLFGEGITAKHFNDDCLGRCLDKIAEYGTTKLFSEITFSIAREKGLFSKRLHLDTTSFSLFGSYDTDPGTGPVPTYGYSKDHRPDLKQVVLSMVQMGPANIPVWMEALDGNSSDKKSFQETVRNVQSFIKGLEHAPDNLCFVVDSAFYVPEKLNELKEIRWITRVPSTLKLAKEYLNIPKEHLDWRDYKPGYKITSAQKNVHAQTHRWVLVESEQAFYREFQTLCRKMEKKTEALLKSLWHLGNQTFSCEGDAKNAIEKLCRKQPYHQIEYAIVPIAKYAHSGRPKKNETPERMEYKIEATLASDLDKINALKISLGRFIIASNECNPSVLSDAELLTQYKEQNSIEGGFRFIKDPAFEIDSFFLKSPERIGALMMIMTLCLMVYNLAQYQVRQCLKENNETLPNQLGKPVKNPTMRWLFQLMNMIAVVCVTEPNQKEIRIVTNLNDIHRRIITYFGPKACEIYGVPTDFQWTPPIKNPKKLRDWCEM